MSWTAPIPVVHDQPTPRVVVEEVIQMLGHEPDDVAAVSIEAGIDKPDAVRVFVREAGALIEHRHTIL